MIVIDCVYDSPGPRIPGGARGNPPFRPGRGALPRFPAHPLGAAPKLEESLGVVAGRAPAAQLRADGRGRSRRPARAAHAARRRRHPRPRPREPGPARRFAQGRADPDARALPAAARRAAHHEGAAEAAAHAARVPDGARSSSARSRGELDLAILALPADTKGLVTRSLFAEAFLVAMPEKHRLAAKKRVKPSDLAGEKLLLLEEGHCLRDQALEVCARVGTEEQDFRATSLETLRQMVAAGLGLTLLPRLAAEGPFASARGLTVRPFAPPAPNRVVGAAWRRSTLARRGDPRGLRHHRAHGLNPRRSRSHPRPGEPPVLSSAAMRAPLAASSRAFAACSPRHAGDALPRLNILPGQPHGVRRLVGRLHGDAIPGRLLEGRDRRRHHRRRAPGSARRASSPARSTIAPKAAAPARTNGRSSRRCARARRRAPWTILPGSRRTASGSFTAPGTA